MSKARRRRRGGSGNPPGGEDQRGGRDRATVTTSTSTSTSTSAAAAAARAAEAASSLWGGHRRSAISRRPRRLRPTEKVVAMMTALVATTATTTKTSTSTATTKRKKTRELVGGGTSEIGRRRRAASSSSAAAAEKKAAPARRKTIDGASAIPTCAVVFNRDDHGGPDEYADVACCLCKCAVDFSDGVFFEAPLKNEAGDAKGARGGMRTNGDRPAEGSTGCLASRDGEGSTQGADEKDDEGDDVPVRLPYRFHDPGNSLMLCDGPAHAKSEKKGNDGRDGSEEGYRCDRAYHQRCHFVPVLSIPRGPWRCLVCRFRDEEYLKEKASRKAKNRSSGIKGKSATLSDSELNAIFRCVPVYSSTPLEDGEWSAGNGMEVVSKSDEDELPMAETRKSIPGVESSINSDTVGIANRNKQSTCRPDIAPDTATCNHYIAKLERRFEALSAHLKSKLLHTELTARSRGIIKSSLATIRTAEHSLRSITETSKARKALAERIESQELGLPQELCQCVMRIAASKTRVRELILNLEYAIQARPSNHDLSNMVQLSNGLNPCSVEEEGVKAHGINGDAIDGGECTGDPVSKLMQWYLQQSESERTADKQANVIATATATAAPVALPNSIKINGKTTQEVGKGLLHHLFPEGTLKRRRHEPRTGEAHINAEARGGDDSSVTSISLDDLKCWNCHGSHATDENDMLLCDGMGCYRSFHMKCLEPQVTIEDVHNNSDDAWFCPLCTANANLTHFAQSEYLGDDYWELPSTKGKICDGNSNGDSSQRMKEWETAQDVFPEAKFELRVAQKLKANIRDEETTTFLAQTLGIITGSSFKDERSETSEDNHLLLTEEDESDDDFDHEEVELLDDESFAEDRDMERQLVKEKIGREELDALSVTSGDGSDSNNGN